MTARPKRKQNAKHNKEIGESNPLKNNISETKLNVFELISVFFIYHKRQQNTLPYSTHLLDTFQCTVSN